MTDTIRCPRCGSDDVTCNHRDGSAHDHVCHACGFSILGTTPDPLGLTTRLRALSGGIRDEGGDVMADLLDAAADHIGAQDLQIANLQRQIDAAETRYEVARSDHRALLDDFAARENT